MPCQGPGYVWAQSERVKGEKIKSSSLWDAIATHLGRGASCPGGVGKEQRTPPMHWEQGKGNSPKKGSKRSSHIQRDPEELEVGYTPLPSGVEISEEMLSFS